MGMNPPDPDPACCARSGEFGKDPPLTPATPGTKDSPVLMPLLCAPDEDDKATGVIGVLKGLIPDQNSRQKARPIKQYHRHSCGLSGSEEGSHLFILLVRGSS